MTLVPRSFAARSRRRRLPYLRVTLALLILAQVVAAMGCSEDTAIRQYRVAKQDSHRTATPASSGKSTPAKEQQMLAAIVPNKDFAWFFKLTGDPDVVVKRDEQFRKMIKSVVFDGSGQPTWKLSEGWQQQITPDDITYGRLTNREAGLTATVTRLPFANDSSEESWRSYIVSNINRWRNQLSLDQQDWQQMAGDLEEFPELSQGPAKAYFVSLTGRGAGGMGAAPFMNRLPPSSESSTEPPPPAGASPDSGAASSPPVAEKQLTYEVPEGWSETPASGMRMAAFTVGDGQASGEVTVIAAGGDIDANIGIWLGQVGVEATADSKKMVLEAAQDVPVNGVVGKLYTIVGPDETAAEGQAEAPTSATILIVDIPWRDAQSLFVKLKASASLVESQREKFVAFVTSIKW